MYTNMCRSSKLLIMHPNYNRYIEEEDRKIVIPDIEDENVLLIDLHPSDADEWLNYHLYKEFCKFKQWY